MSKFKTHSITKTNGLFYAGAVFVTDRLGLKIEKLKKDLSQLEASIDKDISNFRQWERLKRKSSIRVKRLNVVIEEVRQRITATAAKVRKYQGPVDSYRQNRLFENNQAVL